MEPASPLLSSERLLTFVEVARTGGFSSAARRLGKTQSSVSQAVALLEAELGAPLFLRQGRTTVLSDAGRALFGHAERILAAMAEARTHVHATQELRAGQIVVGSSDTLATHVLPPVLGAFRARYPGVEIRLVNRPSPAGAQAVQQGQAHVAVVSLPLPAVPAPASALRGGAAPALTTLPLVAQPDVAIFPVDHALARRRSVDLPTLAGHPLVLLDASTASRAHLERSFAARGLAPRVAMDVTSVEVQKRLVELGFGLAIVPAWAIRRELETRTLATAQIADWPERAVGLVFPARCPAPPVTTAFVAIARAVLAGAPIAQRAARTATRRSSRGG